MSANIMFRMFIHVEFQSSSYPVLEEVAFLHCGSHCKVTFVVAVS
jgi:hypothetical protein